MVVVKSRDGDQVQPQEINLMHVLPDVKWSVKMKHGESGSQV